MLASEVLASLGIKYRVPCIIEGIYEWCGIPRCGKSTLMVKTLVEDFLPAGYLPEDVYANFRIFIDGVHCLSTRELIDAIFWMKEAKVRRKLVLFDEIGQFFGGRSYSDKEQTKCVNFSWQMPKRDIPFLFSSNIGNSADIVLRDVAYQTIMPKYFPGECREDAYISSTVIYNHECRVVKGIVSPHVFVWQRLFDSNEPIE
jgi:hypothetical protein